MSDTESSNGIPEEVAASNILTHPQPQQPPDCNDVCAPQMFSDDEHSGELSVDRDYTGVFEGPEKTLEVCFRRVGEEKNISNVGEVSLAQVTAESGNTGTKHQQRKRLTSDPSESTRYNKRPSLRSRCFQIIQYKQRKGLLEQA